MGKKALPKKDIEKKLETLKGWKYRSNALHRTIELADFPEAISFLVRIAFDAEEADHHPDVTINYRRLKFSLSTHSEGGVTEKDLALARRIDKALAKRSPPA